MKRRYESYAKRALPLARARPTTVRSLRPRLRIVSIIPGIDTGAPERTETSSGFVASPNRLPVTRSRRRERGVDLGAQRVGHVALAEIVDAARAGDREARRHGHAEIRHLGEVGALAAEDRLHVLGSFGAAVAEEVDGLRRIDLSRVRVRRVRSAQPAVEEDMSYP